MMARTRGARFLGVMGLVVGAAACGGADEEVEQTEPVELEFAAVVGEAGFECGQDYQLGVAATPAQVSDLRFYVSEVFLVGEGGERVPLALEDDGIWQNGEVALLDFEDGSGACENGNAEMNKVVRGRVRAGSYEAVEFRVGVPFEQNHQNSAVADSPLNVTSMFWSWQGGYKFLRVDGKAAGEGGFRVHLGSTACEAEDSASAPRSCGNPNRVEVRLEEFEAGRDVIEFDVAELFAGVDMTPDEEGNSAVCMSSPDHQVCEEIFARLGLSFGEASAGGVSVFQVSPK